MGSGYVSMHCGIMQLARIHIPCFKSHWKSLATAPTAGNLPAVGAVQGYFDIQIKICAEYRDKYLRPRRVCQKPVRCSAQILISFVAYIFQFSILFRVGSGTLHFRTNRAPCHWPLSSEWCCPSETIKSPSMLCMDGLRYSRMKTLSGIYATELVKLT